MASRDVVHSERQAVHRSEHQSEQRPTYFVTVISAISALAGLLFGYDTGVISGAILFVQEDFHLTTFQEEIVVSSVLLGATLGALVGGRFADRLGRRSTLLQVATLFAIGAIF